MANTASAKKRMRSSLRKRVSNRPFRVAPRTLVREARAAVEGGASEAAEAVQKAIQQLDKSAKRRVIHPNNAARRKSRLMKLLNKNKSTAE